MIGTATIYTAQWLFLFIFFYIKGALFIFAPKKSAEIETCQHIAKIHNSICALQTLFMPGNVL